MVSEDLRVFYLKHIVPKNYSTVCFSQSKCLGLRQKEAFWGLGIQLREDRLLNNQNIGKLLPPYNVASDICSLISVHGGGAGGNFHLRKLGLFAFLLIISNICNYCNVESEAIASL